MDKKRVALVCAILVVVVGGWMLFNKNSSGETSTNKSVVMTSEPKTQAETTTLHITKADIGKKFSLEGKIVSKHVSSQGHIFTNVLLENGQSIAMPIFSSLQIDKTDIVVGTVIFINGRINEYKGELQIVPKYPDDIKIIKKASKSGN